MLNPLQRKEVPGKALVITLVFQISGTFFHWKMTLGREDESTYSSLNEVNCSQLGEAFVFKGFVAQTTVVDGDEGLSKPDGCVYVRPRGQPLLWPEV